MVSFTFLWLIEKAVSVLLKLIETYQHKLLTLEKKCYSKLRPSNLTNVRFPNFSYDLISQMTTVTLKVFPKRMLEITSFRSFVNVLFVVATCRQKKDNGFLPLQYT